MKKYAVRNLALCTKDCLCLYVCPTGASDTEDSIIDKTKCVGCGNCANACPSHAISLVPYDYPPQQKKEESLVNLSLKLSQSKVSEEVVASSLANKASDDNSYKLFKAIEKSSRLINEDLMRESGYMLPQSNNTHQLLEDLLKNLPSDLDKNIIKELLEIPNNDK